MENRPHLVTESTRLPHQTLNRRSGNEFDAHEEDDEKVEELEDQLNQMANKILGYRSTFPDQLRSTLSVLFEAARPQFPVFDQDTHAAVGDQDITNGISLMKKKISSNVSTMPVVLERMKECMSMMDKLSSHDDSIIYPALKRKRIRKLA